MKKILIGIVVFVLLVFFIILSKEANKPKEWIFQEVHGSQVNLQKDFSIKFKPNEKLNAGRSNEIVDDVFVVFSQVDCQKEHTGTFNKKKFIFKGSINVKICKIETFLLDKNSKFTKRDVVLYVCTEEYCYRDLREINGEGNYTFYIPFPEKDVPKYLYLTSYVYSQTFTGTTYGELPIGLYKIE